MVSIVGSTLIFQGWRLDPLLLLCQALTTSVAFWYGMETFRLRSKEADLPPPQLPPGMGPEGSPLDAVQQAAAAAAAQQQQQQYYQTGAGGFPPAGPGMPYLPPGSESYYPWADPAAAASTSGRSATGPYGETIQYDYYGNPLLPQEPAYSSAGYNTYGTAYGAPGSDPYGGGGPGGDSGEGMYGAAYGAAPGTAATSAGVGYDMRGPSPESGPSYAGPSPASAGPYAAPSSPPPPASPSAQTQFGDRQPPAASSSSSSGSSYFGAGVAPAASALGGTFDNSLHDGFGAVPGTGAAAGAGSSSWGPVPAAGSGAAAAAGASGGGGGPRGSSGGRLDLFERVDDWE